MQRDRLLLVLIVAAAATGCRASRSRAAVKSRPGDGAHSEHFGSRARGPIVLNKVVSGRGHHAGWIEIANRSSQPTDLSGWFVSDKPDRLDHYYQLPRDTRLAAAGSLVVRGGGGDAARELPFVLAHAGSVYLLDGHGLVADAVTYPAHTSIALVRRPDREGPFVRAAPGESP
jgi:hypothetical protein